MSEELQIPENAVYMETIRDYRLSSLNGYVVNFKKGEPTRVPPQCYLEAVRAGAVMCEEQPDEKAPTVVTDGTAKGSKEAAELEAEAKAEHIKQACLKLMAEDDSTKFKADSYPKLNAVIAEIPPECPRPTSADVMIVMDNLRENIDLADLD